jgi:hypothetical protein
MFNRDRMIYGRAFMSVGANEDNRELPWSASSHRGRWWPRSTAAPRSITAAARFYGQTARSATGPTKVTLYNPDSTVWVERSEDGRWYEVDRDDHGLGVVPVVMHLNRRLSGGWRASRR